MTNYKKVHISPPNMVSPCELNLFYSRKRETFLIFIRKNVMNKEIIFNVCLLFCMSIWKMHENLLNKKNAQKIGNKKMTSEKKRNATKIIAQNHHVDFHVYLSSGEVTTSDIHHWVSLQLQTLIIVNLFMNCCTKNVEVLKLSTVCIFFLRFFFASWKAAN